MCNTYCLFTAAIIARTRLNVTLHVLVHLCCHIYYLSHLMPKQPPLYFVLRHSQSVLVRLVKITYILGFLRLNF